MVDRLDLVGPYNSTDQSVCPGLDVDQAKYVPFIRRGYDVSKSASS